MFALVLQDWRFVLIGATQLRMIFAAAGRNNARQNETSNSTVDTLDFVCFFVFVCVVCFLLSFLY